MMQHYAADAQEAYLQSVGQSTEYLDNRYNYVVLLV